jgi:peptidyl-prolyl cis-trans isomerase A (cyclophilin A)
VWTAEQDERQPKKKEESQMKGRIHALAPGLALVAIMVVACGPGDKPAADTTPAAPAPSAALLTPDSAALVAAAPDSFDVVFETSKGNFTVRTRRAWAPLGADRFHYLVANGFFDDTRFFRVIPGFVAQFGLNGNPAVSAAWESLTIQDDPVKVGNKKGRITYAKGGPNSRTTQVFINLADNDGLDAMGFPAFGEVIDGMSVVESINGEYGNPPDDQQMNIRMRGNAYLAESYPRLDQIKTAKIIHHH